MATAFCVSVLIGLYLTVRLRSALARDLGELSRAIRKLSDANDAPPTWTFECNEFRTCSEELAHASQQLRQRYERLNADATLDALTGLANRRTLMYALERETALALRTGWPLALIMVDIDHFKKLNDTYGHQAGDHVLQRTARRLASLVRESDVVARFGGEEFAVLLPGTHLDHAAEIAGQLRNALRCDQIGFDGHELSVTASFGVAEIHTCGLADTAALISASDAALYKAKENGRDQVVTADRTPGAVANVATGARRQPEPVRPTYAHETAIDRDTLALMGSTFTILQVMPDRRRVAQDILQQVATVLHCHDASLWVTDDARRLQSLAQINSSIMSTARRLEIQRYAQAWFDDAQSENTSDAVASEAQVLEPNESCPIRRILIPLNHGSNLRGVIQAVAPPDFELQVRQRTVLSALAAIGVTAIANCEAYKRYEERWVGLIEALCHTIQSHVAYKRDHGERVGELVIAIARCMGLRDEDELQVIRIAGLVHDIGKIKVPPKILQKRGRLRPGERNAMQEHCRIGAEIINRAPDMERLASIVLHHHEHYDGGGYPHGLAGDEIPIESRVLAVADAFDAMVSPRPYRSPLSHEEAIKRIRQASGTQFDPTVVMAFLEFMENQKDEAQTLHSQLAGK